VHIGKWEYLGISEAHVVEVSKSIPDGSRIWNRHRHRILHDLLVHRHWHTHMLEDVVAARFAIAIFNKWFLKKLDHEISALSVIFQNQ